MQCPVCHVEIDASEKLPVSVRYSEPGQNPVYEQYHNDCWRWLMTPVQKGQRRHG